MQSTYTNGCFARNLGVIFYNWGAQFFYLCFSYKYSTPFINSWIEIEELLTPPRTKILSPFQSFISTQAIILVGSQPFMYAPPSIIRKGFFSRLFLIQYAMANDLGWQAFYQQEDSLASPLLTFEYTLPTISDPSRFTTPFTSGSTNSKISTDLSGQNLDPLNGNDSENFPLSSNEYCNSAAKQSYPSRRQRKRQNEKDFCNDPTPGASHRLVNNNNPTAKPKPPAQQNSVPNPNGSGETTQNKTPLPDEDNINLLRIFLNSMSGLSEKIDPTSCNIPKYPLFRVPVCAIPAPGILKLPSPASVITECKFSKWPPFCSASFMYIEDILHYLPNENVISACGRVW